MDTIEEALEVTQLANQDLQSEIAALREENDRLTLENEELRQRLGLTADNRVVSGTIKTISGHLLREHSKVSSHFFLRVFFKLRTVGD